MSSGISRLAVLIGTANPTPTLPPLGEKMAVLTPMTSALELSTGPLSCPD